eukprot:Skav217924  [mRNA]  locus=scaffold2633:82599:89681:- [translate_table: standard]
MVELQSDKQKLEAELEARAKASPVAVATPQNAGDAAELQQLKARSAATEAELQRLKESLAKAEGKSKETLTEREKLKTDLESAKRDLAQAQSRELCQRAAASKTEESLKEAVQSRLEAQQTLEQLKAVNSSSDSERAALTAQVASLEATRGSWLVRLESRLVGLVRQALRQQELSRLREKHLHSASEAAGKLSSVEARAAEAEARRHSETSHASMG